MSGIVKLGGDIIGAVLKPFMPKIDMPRMPDLPPAPGNAPDLSTAQANVDAAARQQEDDMRKRRRGRASNILTGELGAGLPPTAAKTLLGD